MGVPGTQHPEHLLGGLLVETLRGHGEATTNPVEVIVPSTTVAERLVLHSATALVELHGHVAHDVELVGNQFSLGQDRLEDAAVGAREIEGARADLVKPLLSSGQQPAFGLGAFPAGDEVEKLALFHIHQSGHEVLGPSLAEFDEQVLVESQRADLAETVRVLDQHFSEGDHGIIHGVPVTAEHRGHLVHRASVRTDLEGDPARCSVSQFQS